jgi:hypothetical protein
MFKDLSKKTASIIAATGLVVGLLVFFGLRVVFVQDHHTHYHANFALYINGQRDTFDSFAFYEEVQSCSVDNNNDPKTRVHMHNQDNSLVHVHDDNVTWGAFFANLGYGLFDDAIETSKGIFIDGKDDKKLTFILNGQKVDTVANRVIQSEDALLIDYGNANKTQDEYDQIKHTAHDANTKQDPATCSGSHKLTFKDRLKRALDFKN